MPLILGANSATAGGLTVPNSCRFNTADSANVYWTPGGVGNRRKWTWSGWGKINAVEALSLFSAASGTSYCECSRNVSGVLDFVNVNSGVLTGRRQLSQLFRDPSAWMHFCLVWDSDNATALQQMRVYINGTEVTDFALTTNPAGTDSVMNNTVRTNVGSSNGGGPFMAGYLADVCFIDGLALTPTSFGEFDTDTPKVFKPIDVSGLTFGTNGFHLDFQDSADLGNDAAGSNNLTSGGLAATDQCTDTPDNNFATLNPLLTSSYATLTEGNTTSTASSTNNANSASTICPQNGKWYVEAKARVVEGNHYPRLGMYSLNNTTVFGRLLNGSAGMSGYGGTDEFTLYSNGTLYVNQVTTSSWASAQTNGDIIQIAVDCDNGAAYMGINNTWQNSGDPTSGASKTGAAVTWTPADSDGIAISSSDYNGSFMDYNFGNPSYSNSSDAADGNNYGRFEYAPPSLYFALCTKNLAEFG